MRVFQSHTHPKYNSHCLVGVTGTDGDDSTWLRRYSDGVFVADGNQWYVLVKDDEYNNGCWEHPEHGRVGLWNTHPTGELRWEERISKYCTRMEPHALQAVRHFGIKMFEATDEEWAAILDEHTLKIEDLSDVEIQMLLRADNREGSARVVTMEKVKLLEDDGAEWHDTIRGSDEASAVHSLQTKGLVDKGGESSGTGFGQESHIYRTKLWYYISKRGRDILKHRKA
jgi:hypothetical protein